MTLPMTMRSAAVCAVVAAMAMACGTQQVNLGTGPTGSSTGSSTAASGTTSSGGISGTSATSGGAGSSVAGTTSSGSTSAGSSSSGTTGGRHPFDPYQGYDSGPRIEPAIAPGCSAAQPVVVDTVYCAQCLTTADCPAGLFCNTSYACVPCRGSDCPQGETCNDCPAGEVCDLVQGQFPPNAPLYAYTADPRQCRADCRDAGSDFCQPGLCDPPTGQCISGACQTDAQCVVNGRGACDTSYQASFGYGLCRICMPDAGGCFPGEVCVVDTSASFTPFPTLCQPSCLLDGGACHNGTTCTDSGACVPGCQSNADCIGDQYGQTLCSDGQCVRCVTDADCPDYAAGCGDRYGTGSLSCDVCSSDSQCLTGHCSRMCICYSSDECPTDAPVCVGGDADAGTAGRCACTDSSQCLGGMVCEGRFPFTVYGFDSTYPPFGGACIPACDVADGTDCVSAAVRVGQSPADRLATVCNAQTGYCDNCVQDSDCPMAPDGGASATPTCVSYPNGNEPQSSEPVGGGECGCSATTDCNDGNACWLPGILGTCLPPCTLVGSVDSCNPPQLSSPPGPWTTPLEPFCNTLTGGCVECLDDYDCTNQGRIPATDVGSVVGYQSGGGWYVGPFGDQGGLAAPRCAPSGRCVGCLSNADCPTTAPNCILAATLDNPAPSSGGFCGLCRSDVDCLQTAGFRCLELNNWWAGFGQCLIPCVPDANEQPTDAGNTCPSPYAWCTTGSNAVGTYSVCAQCRLDLDGGGDGDCTDGGTCQLDGTCR
jgi:hypothetical protein